LLLVKPPPDKSKRAPKPGAKKPERRKKRNGGVSENLAEKRQVAVDTCPRRGHHPLFIVLADFPAIRCQYSVAIEAIAVYYLEPRGNKKTEIPDNREP
jgi:hypothetical protein